MALDRRTFVVESDPDSRALLCQTLKAEGFNVQTAETGRRPGRAQAEPGRPGLHAHDLPDTTGLNLRRTSAPPDPPR